MFYKFSFNYGFKVIYFLVALFTVVFFAYFFIQSIYVHKTELNYTDAIHKETKLLIEIKKMATFNIVRTLANNKKLLHVMKNKQYDKLYDENFFPLAKRFEHFQNLSLHIVDKDGINRYLSWTYKSVGSYVLNIRKDLKQVFNDHKALSSISVGKFDITFKGVVPLYDSENNFLGVIEAITHFNSISNQLSKDDIYSATIIEKRFNQQLIYPISKKFIEGYNISTLQLNPEVQQLLLQHGVKTFTSIKTYEYFTYNSFLDGFYVLNVPILDIHEETIGYFLVFIKDKYHLNRAKFILNVLMILMNMLFLLMSYLVYKEHKKNTDLVLSLNEEVQRQTEKNLQLIYHDNLTGCYTQEKFKVDSKKYLKNDIVMLNIKNFSQINETYGFNVGNDVLVITVQRLENLLEQKIYRIDADEFVFVSNDIEKDISKIKDLFVQSSIFIAQNNINIKISFSFAAVHGGSSEILKKLVISLKQAKKEPFKKYVYYKKQVLKNDFIKYNNFLYDAIYSQNNAQIIPYFQGIRDNKTQQILKYEALARLEVNGTIYTPYYFITIAKNSGFIFEITKIMIEKSFEFLSKQDENINISINITEDDLLSNQLKEYLVKYLELYNLNAKRITLEILEGISSTGTKNNIRQLKALKEVGFKLAIDDFGVEYSNFERINELDIDFIKIDGKYIQNIHTNSKSFKITKAITDFAKSMDIKVIAEFVENEAIQEVIETLHIDYSQGYYFSKPSKTLL